ncbi:MAG: hypothetical protein MJ208_00845 [Bacilli bacterium]|nr:hypothetical protein [Bacilli bacterium]
MKQKVHLVIPFVAILSAASMNSCGNNGRLKNRDSFPIDAISAVGINPTMEAIENAQIDTNDYFKTPNKGTVTMNVDIKIAGGLKFVMFNPSTQEYEQYEFNNINLMTNNKSIIKWDFNHDNYFDVVTKDNEYYFIKKVDDELRKYYVSPIDGNKYYLNITEQCDANHFRKYENFVMHEIASNLGIFVPARELINSHEVDIVGAGFDISGFGNDIKYHWIGGDQPKPPEGKEYFVENYFAPGLIFDDRLRIATQEQYPIVDYIDSIIGNEDITALLPIKAKYTRKEDMTAATINYVVDNYHFDQTEELIKLIAKTLGKQPTVSASGSGTASIDYFLSYLDNFIHQQEMVIDLSNANLRLVITKQEIPYYIVELKDFNAHCLINELFENGVCDYQEPDTNGYIEYK